jgi:hypothetical protein
LAVSITVILKDSGGVGYGFFPSAFWGSWGQNKGLKFMPRKCCKERLRKVSSQLYLYKPHNSFANFSSCGPLTFFKKNLTYLQTNKMHIQKKKTKCVGIQFMLI